MLPLRREVAPHRPMVGAVLAVWAAAVIGGLGLVLAGAAAPGPAADARAWPADSQLVRAAGVPTLIMFAHPRCACTAASLTELATFVAEARGRVAARVVFVQPADASGDWARTDHWAQAMAIPGVTVSIDTEGCEGRRFGAQTSGQVVLYAADGRLLYRGDIASARGQIDAGVGRDRIAALLAAGSADRCALVEAAPR